MSGRKSKKDSQWWKNYRKRRKEKEQAHARLVASCPCAYHSQKRTRIDLDTSASSPKVTSGQRQQEHQSHCELEAEGNTFSMSLDMVIARRTSSIGQHRPVPCVEVCGALPSKLENILGSSHSEDSDDPAGAFGMGNNDSAAEKKGVPQGSYPAGQEGHKEKNHCSVEFNVMIEDEKQIETVIPAYRSESEDFLSDDDNCEMHFLEEAPDTDVAGDAQLDTSGGDDPEFSGGEGPDNPDDTDPDDPGFPQDADGENEDDEEDGNYINFNHHSLGAQLRFIRAVTARESLLLSLALALKHNWSYEALIDHMKSQNTLYGMKFLPQSKKQLWRVLNRSQAGLVKHAYCNRCMKYIGKLKNLPNQFVCTCGFTTRKSKVKIFVSLSLRRQLQTFLSMSGAHVMLQYRVRKMNQTVSTVEDIYDGKEYRRLTEKGGPLSSNMNFSYVINTDGFKLGKSARLSAWPLFVRLNEIAPNLRQKFRFLAGLWVDTKDPDMNTFLAPFVTHANSLAGAGVVWKPDGLNEVHSLFVPTCLCVDSKARCTILNMKQYNGFFGCTFCDHKGAPNRGPVKYPILPHPDVPPPALRTDGSIRAAMREAAVTSIPQKGVLGPSVLMNLLHFDLVAGNAVDDLHPLYERSVSYHTDLLFDSEPLRNLTKVLRNQMTNSRLLRIKTPSCISRKPSKIEERPQWKGTEMRNWLIYYSIPCLQGLFPPSEVQHFEMLSHAAFLLSQDVIQLEELETAEDLLIRYVTQFEETFGVGCMRYSIHLLTHIVQSIRNWGPFWAYSTFGFESWNLKFRKTVTSPKGCIDQMVNRHLLASEVRLAIHNEDVPKNVRDQIAAITEYSRCTTAHQVGCVHVLGKVETHIPTAEERMMLHREGYECANLCKYKTVLIGSSRYHPTTHRDDDQLSDDTHVYTVDDTFCVIQAIVVFEMNDDEVCGLFVHELEVELPFTYAKHIARVKRDRYEPHFIPVDRVRCPAVRVLSCDKMYVIPVPNQFEID